MVPKDWPSLSERLVDLREGKFQSIAKGISPREKQSLARLAKYLSGGELLTFPSIIESMLGQLLKKKHLRNNILSLKKVLSDPNCSLAQTHE